MPGKLIIGTSGYSYNHWKSKFYPKGLPASEWLEYYSKKFSSVELNYTFYKLPEEKTFISWNKKTPESFIFSIKASRFITHIKRLKDSGPSIKLLIQRLKTIRKKLGPILFQLPPNFALNKERLEDFVSVLPKKYDFVFEFRDPSWFDEKVFEILKKRKLGFCIYNMPGMDCPHAVTSDFVYIRFHGSGEIYSSNYTDKQLKLWAAKIKGFLKNNLDVYVYFNNDANAFAINNALKLKQLLKA